MRNPYVVEITNMRNKSSEKNAVFFFVCSLAGSNRFIFYEVRGFYEEDQNAYSKYGLQTEIACPRILPLVLGITG